MLYYKYWEDVKMVNKKLIEGLNHFSPVYQGEEGDEFVEPHFGRFGCDACNTVLGGDRYDIKCRTEADEIIEIEVCTDCYVELCS